MTGVYFPLTTPLNVRVLPTPLRIRLHPNRTTLSIPRRIPKSFGPSTPFQPVCPVCPGGLCLRGPPFVALDSSVYCVPVGICCGAFNTRDKVIFFLPGVGTGGNVGVAN